MEKIPRQIHVVWLRDESAVAEEAPSAEWPPLVGRCIESLYQHHSSGNWQVRVWRDADVSRDNFPIVYDSLQRIESPAQRVDLLRMELLYRHGGWYVDADVFFCQPLERLYEPNSTCYKLLRWPPLTDQVRDAAVAKVHVAVVCHEDDSDEYLSESMSTSVIGSSVANPLFELAAKRGTLAQFNTANINETTGPLLFGQCLGTLLHQTMPLLIGRLPSRVFYPSLWNVGAAEIIEKLQQQRVATAASKNDDRETLAAHCWLASWKKT